jgi:hypothetical protein
MNTLPSSEFRRRYASLNTDTLVTVSGHVIGKWTPMGRDHVKIIDGEAFVERDPSYVTERPFTPAPKPAKRK